MGTLCVPESEHALGVFTCFRLLGFVNRCDIITTYYNNSYVAKWSAAIQKHPEIQCQGLAEEEMRTALPRLPGTYMDLHFTYQFYPSL